ncbi:MAG: csrA [Nitrospira sp.]|jgi:carbon storage regulator|nr:csrA [Nitrospira sp.]
MLVLSRRRGEGVTIGADVRIVVLGIKGGQVRLGIEAPPNVAVHRDEVHARIQEENQLAAGPGVIPLEAFRQLSNKSGRRRA